MEQEKQHSEALDRAAHPVRHEDFDRFVATISALRAPDGCPWDREQTHQSIAHNMIEEAYEAVDAIESGDAAHLREELGDVLLQVVLQSQIASDQGEFDIDDVAADVNAKMVRRHPHVFGTSEATDAAEVLSLWDQVKLAEKKAADENAAQAGFADAGDRGELEKPAGLLDGVPVSFPALMQAEKISRKAAAAGFEWDTLADVWDQVESEIDELNEAYGQAPKAANGKVEGDPEAMARVEEELGDVLFSMVNVARRMGVNAENALRASCRKFRGRWAAMEQMTFEQGVRLEDVSTKRQNELWKLAKEQERR